MKRDAYITRLRLAAPLLGGKGYASGGELQAALVAWRGMELFPVAYQLAYESDGATVRHTAVLQEPRRKTIYYARLSEVAEPAPPEPYAPSPPAWEPGGGKSGTEAIK